MGKCCPDCGPKSQCKTKRCPCHENGNCKRDCKCHENRRKKEQEEEPPKPEAVDSKHAESDQSDNDTVTPKKSLPTSIRTFSNASKTTTRSSKIAKPGEEVFSYATDLNKSKELRENFSKDLKTTVLKYRNGEDIYQGTALNLADSSGMPIDHVIEIQFLTHAVARVLYNKPRLFNKFQPGLKKSINVVENYNVTTTSLNSSKMNACKSFLHHKMYKGFPLLSLMIGTKCEKYLKQIGTAMIDSYESVDYNLSQVRLDEYVSGHSDLDKIIEEFHNLHVSMRLEEMVQQ